jgi:hypothetical protein
MPPGVEAGRAAVFQVYNRISWLNALSRVTKVELEHVDAPVLKKIFHRRVPRSAEGIFPRAHRAGALPVKTRLHGGLEGNAVQHVLRRIVQRDAEIAGAPSLDGTCCAFCEV